MGITILSMSRQDLSLAVRAWPASSQAESAFACVLVQQDFYFSMLAAKYPQYVQKCLREAILAAHRFFCSLASCFLTVLLAESV